MFVVIAKVVFVLYATTISVKTNENFDSPLPPISMMKKKKARFGLRANSSLIWGEGGFISHFIVPKIVVFL